MSDRTELPSSVTQGLPFLESSNKAVPAHTASDEQTRARIASLEREARALGQDPAAALLFHEIGMLWEDPLRNPRNAAIAYQSAYKLAPTFIGNIQAARRLFADVGNWQMVVQLLDAEISASADDAVRASLLLEKAQVLESRLSREDDAQRALRQCLDAAPKDVSLLVQLEAWYAEKGEHASLVEVYLLLANALRDDTLRARYLALAAELLEHRLQRTEEASRLLRQAFALDKRDALLLAAEIRSSEREGRFEDLLAALNAQAELLGELAAPTFLRIARVYETQGRPEDALAALLAARRLSPDEPLVLAELAQIYEAQGRHEELADVLLSRVAAVTDETELVAINLRLAALYEEELKRDDAAIDRYRAIIGAVPGHRDSLAGLGKLFHRRREWERLVEVFDAELAALEDPKQQAPRMYRAAEIFEERLGRQEDAISRYSRCLQLLPGYLPAQKALTRLYERQGRWSDLVAMYEQDLLQLADREEMIATLLKMASIYEDRLSDLDHAIDCMRRILEIRADHLASIRHLARLYERAGRWLDLIAIHEAEAGLVGDTRQVVALAHRSAEVLEEQLQDRAGATAAWERLLAISPSYLPALKALGRLYAEDGRWLELIRMYRAEAEISPSVEQAASLIHKIGELYERRLEDEGEAIAAYQEVLTLSPSHLPALRALGRIYRSQGAWENLVEVLCSEAANRTDPRERANVLFQAAAIWENQLGHAERAVEGYQEVLRLDPGHAAALGTLERLHTLRNEVKELIAVLDRETQTHPSPQARINAYLKLAHLYLDRLNEPVRAAKCAEAALLQDATNLTALKVLERVRAGDRARRSEVRLRLADRVGEPGLSTALRLSAAADREQPGVETTHEELAEAFEANPTDARLSFQLERQLRRTGDFGGLLEALRTRLELHQDAQERAGLLIKMADLAHHKLDDRSAALGFYRETLELQPGFLPALQGLCQLHLAANELAEARAMLELEGTHSRNPEGAIEAWIRAGQLAREQQSDLEGAAACYRKALELNPLEPRATTGLEELLLAAQGGAAELASLQEKRAEAWLARKHAQPAADGFHAAARAWLEGLGDREKADAAVERALEAIPVHPGALELKARLAFDAQRHAEAAAALALRIQQGGEQQELAALHLQLGGIYQDHLSDATRSAAHLQTALAANPGSAEALERLATIHSLSRNWTGAADCLRRLLDLGGDPTTLARHTLSLAQIFDEGLGDAQQAAELCRRALELAPGEDGTISRLVELQERLGNLPELADLLEQQAQGASHPGRAIALLLRAAELLAGPVDDAPRAIALYRRIVELDPSNATARSSLAALYTRDGASLPQAIEEHREVLRLEPSSVENLHALFRLWESTKQLDRAFCAAGVLHFFRAANEAEAAFYGEARNRLPQDGRAQLDDSDVGLLMPRILRRHPLLETMRAIGDQLGKLHPPNFESAGIDRKADRLKNDSPVHKAIQAVASLFGVEEFDVYQSRRGLMFLETTEPLAVCVGQDVIRKFNVREQKFLIGRVVLGLLNKTAVLQKLSNGEAADLIGNSVRIFHPEFESLGRANDEATKQLRKACSRKALKSLEEPASEFSVLTEVPMVELLEALSLAADRAGLLVCADVATGLNMLVRAESNNSNLRSDAPEPFLNAVKARHDVRQLLEFALSDEFFRLRQKLGLAV